MFRTTVIGITGSVGKTTAKELLAAIMGDRGSTLKTRNNENDEYGIPNTIRALRPWHRFAVIELGTTNPGTVRRSARLVRPDVAVVLAVARTHTNVFRTLEDTAREKASLLEYLPRRGIAILNADDPRVRAMRSPAGVRTVLFGATQEAEVRAFGAAGDWPARLTLEVAADDQRVTVCSQLVGTHWTPSVLGALTAARACGVPLVDAARKVADVAPFTARLQPLVLPSGAMVLRDEYNGSLDTLEAMVKVMREARAVRRILVFSDLSDSRLNQKRRQREIGRLAAELTDLAIFIGAHAHHAVKGALDAGMSPEACHFIVGVTDAAALLKRELREGDLVFVKGRTTDHLSRVILGQFGEIGCRAITCTVRRSCDHCDRLQPGFDLDAALAGAIRTLPDLIPVKMG